MQSDTSNTPTSKFCDCSNQPTGSTIIIPRYGDNYHVPIYSGCQYVTNRNMNEESTQKRIYKRSLTPLEPTPHQESKQNGPVVVSIPDKNKIVYQNPSQEFYSRRTRLVEDDQNMEHITNYGDEPAEQDDYVGYPSDVDENQAAANRHGNNSDQEPDDHEVLPIYGNNGKNVAVEEDIIEQSEYDPRYDQQVVPAQLLIKRPAPKKNIRCKCSRKKIRNNSFPVQPQLEEDDYSYSTNGYKPVPALNDYQRSVNINQRQIASPPLSAVINHEHELVPDVNLFEPNQGDFIYPTNPNEDSTRLASDVVNTYMQKQDDWKLGLLNDLRESLSDCCETCRSRTLKKMNDRLEDIQGNITKELSQQYKAILNSVRAAPHRNAGKCGCKQTNTEDIFQVQLDKNLGEYFKKVVFKISNQKPDYPVLRQQKPIIETRQNLRRKSDRLYNGSQTYDNVQIEAIDQPFESVEYVDRSIAPSAEYPERSQESAEYLERRRPAPEEHSVRPISRTRNYRRRMKQPKLNYSDREP